MNVGSMKPMPPEATQLPPHTQRDTLFLSVSATKNPGGTIGAWVGDWAGAWVGACVGAHVVTPRLIEAVFVSD